MNMCTMSQDNVIPFVWEVYRGQRIGGWQCGYEKKYRKQDKKEEKGQERKKRWVRKGSAVDCSQLNPL